MDVADNEIKITLRRKIHVQAQKHPSYDVISRISPRSIAVSPFWDLRPCIFNWSISGLEHNSNLISQTSNSHYYHEMRHSLYASPLPIISIMLASVFGDSFMKFVRLVIMVARTREKSNIVLVTRIINRLPRTHHLNKTKCQMSESCSPALVFWCRHAYRNRRCRRLRRSNDS